MVKAEAHAYEKLGKDLKIGKIPGLVVLYGSEEFLVHFYANAIINKYISEPCKDLDLVTLTKDNVTLDAIIDNLETISLMSERKVVFIPDFIDSKGKGPKALDGSAADKFAEYVKTIPQGSLLLVTISKQEDERGEAGLKKLKLFKAMASAGAEYEFGPLNQGQLRGFIEKRLRASGKKYRSAVPEFIARESGYGSKAIDYGLYTLNNDLQKLLAFCLTSDEIRVEDAREVLTYNPENDVFAMLDAIGRNRKDEAFRLLHNILENGGSEFQLLALITKQLELMLMAREMREDGMNLTAIQKALKKSERAHEYRVKKALDLGNRFTVSDMRRMLSSSYDVEVNIKTGLMPSEIAMEFFVAGI